jgi:hypothetical protein
MKMKFILIAFLLIAGLILVACEEFSEIAGPQVRFIEEKYTVDELKEKILEVNSNLDSYTLDTSTIQDSKIETEGKQIKTKTEMKFKINNDLLNNRLGVKGSMISSITGMRNEIDTEIYMIDDVVYAQVLGQWMKSQISEEDMEKILQQQDELEPLLELLETSKIERLEDEIIGGKSYYVIKIIPDVRKLFEMILQEQAGAGTVEKEKLDELNLEKMVQNVSVIWWVDKESFFLEKQTMKAKTIISPELIGQTGGEDMRIETDLLTEMLMTNINKPISITLPPETANAKEMTGLQAEGVLGGI